MQQLTKNYIGWWLVYKRHVKDVVLANETARPGEVAYWRNAVFCKILTYLTPLSLIAVVPSVIMAFQQGVPVVGFSDLFAFFGVCLLTVCPGIRLEVRKATLIFALFCLSVILLYYLPLPGPGLLFALAVTVLSSLIYSSAAALLSSWANTVICISFGLLIYFGIKSPVSSVYSLGSWIATSSNLILLSFAFAKCMDLLLTGLTAALDKNKISEAKLERANRLYQFISQINQTIVHVKDADTLFRKSCDIAIAFGEYKMAWIGGFDITKRKISLLDSSGMSEQDIKSFTDVTFDFDSPEDYILRTGKYFLCNDLECIFKIERWRRYAEEHNIKSVIVLPIRQSGSIVGTFNLYATELNHFAEDDLELLNEVTGDISFALDMFDKAERHKEAEEELQKNYAELEAASNEQSAILNTLPASIALLDHEGNILKVNDEWTKFGRANGLQDAYQHLGKNYIEICEKSLGTDAQDGKRMAAGIKEILNGAREYFTMEYPCDAPNEKRWFKAKVKPFNSHQLTGAVVMHVNISERKKAETEMLLLINNTEESFVLLDSDLHIMSFNSQFRYLYNEYFGLQICKGDSILDYAPEERKDSAVAIYKRVLEGNVEESEIMIPGSNDTTIYFSLKYSPAKDESGNIFGVFVTALDITGKRKAEEQKEYERRNKEALINSTEDLIWSLSNDFKLITANNAFVREMKKFAGIDVRPGDNFSALDSVPNEFIKHWEGHYRRALLGESFKSEIYTPEFLEREETWVEASFSPIIANEQIAGIACYSRNITERKKAEYKLILTSTALQRAVNELNKVMDSSMDVICAVDAEGKFLKVSAASDSVWGYKPEELIGKPLVNFVCREDKSKSQLMIAGVRTGGEENYLENRFVRKDGSLVPVEWTVKWDPKDQIGYGVARDISEKKRLVNVVENERKRFQDLFSEAPTSMGVLSGPDHVFETVNPLYLQLIGREDIIGKTVKEVLPETVDQGVIELLDNVYETGRTFSNNETLIKLDILGTGQLVDKYLNFMYQAHRTEDDKIDGILFFVVDVTEQVALRQKIEESEATLKEAQALLHICNWEIDLGTNSSSWSDELYDLLGLSKGEIEPSPQTFLSLLHPEDVDFAKSVVEKTFQTFQADSFSARVKGAEDNILYIYCEWKFEFDDNQTPVRLYGIVQDITERKFAELERTKITNDLIQRNRDLEQFTFIISHNLRAPTANIIGFTEFLQDETLAKEEQKEFLSALASSVKNLDNVIKDINSILQVKLEVTEKREVISFSKLVSDISLNFSNLIEKNHVRIVTDFSEIDEIFSLNVYFHSIFHNLISNSIKYGKPGEPTLIEIKSKFYNGKTILTFTDNGLGIDLETKGEKVFGLYSRFHSHVEGKGMGLFMVKTQVEAIGGHIFVSSAVNEGTEFSIVFEN